MHWEINKHAPIALPPGYTMIAAEIGQSVPVTAAVSSGIETSAVSAKQDKHCGEVRQHQSYRELATAGIDEVMKQLLNRAGYDSNDFQLKKYKSGKPYGLLNGRELGVSITHSRSLLICSLYTEGETGIDAEPCNRTLHPRLYNRICHPEEMDDEISGIRLWTVKEAILKYTGTGLRLAMNKIKLEMLDNYRLRAELEHDTITVASFTFQKHWIAAAFQDK